MKSSEYNPQLYKDLLHKLIYKLESQRVWGGMGWTYYPINPTLYQAWIKDIREVLFHHGE